MEEYSLEFPRIEFFILLVYLHVRGENSIIIIGIFLRCASNIISVTLHASLIYADILEEKHSCIKFA